MPLNLFGRKPAPEESALPAEESPRGGPTMTTATVRDQLIVTYAVPPERLSQHIPPGLSLDRLPDAEGNAIAFVQVVGGLYQAARWSPLPEFVGDDFYQVIYRILVRRTVPSPTSDKDAKPEKRAVVWVLRTFANTSERFYARRLVDKAVDYARISLFVDGDPARNRYNLYRVRAEADSGQTHLTAKFPDSPPPIPAPFGSEADMTAFLTQRTEQLFNLSMPGSTVGLLPLRHAPLTPVRGELMASARLTPLIDAGILQGEEVQKPHSILLQPILTVHAYPPRPIKLSMPEG